MDKFGYVYIMTNKNKTTLYIGVTNDLPRRIYEHKNHLLKGAFTDKYNLEYCIYYEEFAYFDLAIQREKELKKWNRQKKEALINKKNPEWKELVTENGFVGKQILGLAQDDAAEGTVMIKQIPHFVRDDNPSHAVGTGLSGGGEAATAQSPSSYNTPSFRRSGATEESAGSCGNATTLSMPTAEPQRARHSQSVYIGGNTTSHKQALVRHLRQFVEKRRAERFEQVIQSRTRHLTVVLEDIFQSQNASAVLRSCECMGVQDVHVIENSYVFETHPDIALGANKWLDIFQYNAPKTNNTLKAIENLRKKDYKIVATTPHKNGFFLEELPIDHKIALFFGTEQTGLSDDVIEQADYFMKIPMHGFTESYNISVSAAISMYELTKKIRQSSVNWHLSEEERVDILLEWFTRSIRMSEQIIAEWQKKIQP